MNINNIEDVSGRNQRIVGEQRACEIMK